MMVLALTWRSGQAWLDTESEYRLMEQKHTQAKEGAKYASEKYEKWAVWPLFSRCFHIPFDLLRGTPERTYVRFEFAVAQKGWP
jgi:hypothetical protein